jgi:hypothetical protein
MKPNDAEFCVWLRDVREVNTEWVLNKGNEKDLRKEYERFLEEVESGTKISIEAINKLKDFERSYDS